MKKNVGSIDRVVRIVLGLALLSLTVILSAPWAYLGLIGLVPLVTAALGTCPLYSLLGIDTCPADRGPGPRKSRTA